MSRTWTPGQAVMVVVLTWMVVVSGIATVASAAIAQQHLTTQPEADALSSGERLNNSATTRSSHTVEPGWNTAGANAANTNYINTTGPTSPITVRWTFTSEANNFKSGPLVVNGTVYFGTKNGTLYALDAWTGETRWTFKPPAGTYPNNLAVLRNTVYVGAYNDRVYAINVANGDRFWTFRTDGRPTGLTVANRTLYVTSKGTRPGATVPDGKVYALGALRGEEKWAFTTEGPAFGPAVKDGTVYVSARYGNVYALNGETGAVNWNVDVDKDTENWLTKPSVANGLVYVTKRVFPHTEPKSILYALDVKTGEEHWKRTKPKADTIPTPSVLGDTIYFTSKYLHAANAKTGTDRWSRRSLKGTPVLLNDIGYIRKGGKDGTLYTLNPATGDHTARFTPPPFNNSWDRFRSPMAVLNGSLYMGVGIDEPNIRGRSDHTIFYALGTPEFRYTNPSISPRDPDVNQSVTVTVTVRNTGTGPGMFNATLAVNGNEVNTTTARLDPRTNKTITFNHTFQQKGTYTVTIGGFTRKIAVGDVAPATTATGDWATPTPTATSQETATASGNDSTRTTTPGTVPGFGVGVSVVGVIVVIGLLAGRRCFR